MGALLYVSILLPDLTYHPIFPLALQDEQLSPVPLPPVFGL
jgi:hypothetical protein